MRAWHPRVGWLAALLPGLLVSVACVPPFLQSPTPTPTAVLVSPRSPIVVTVQVPGPAAPTPVSAPGPTPPPLQSPRPSPTPSGAVPGQPIQTPTGDGGKVPVIATPTPGIAVTRPTPVPAPTLPPAPTVVVPVSPQPGPGTSPVTGAPTDIFLVLVQQSMTGRVSLVLRNNGAVLLETGTNQRREAVLSPEEVSRIRADFEASGFLGAQSTYGQPSAAASTGITYTPGPGQTKAVVIHGSPPDLPTPLQALRLSLDALVTRIAQGS